MFQKKRRTQGNADRWHYSNRRFKGPQAAVTEADISAAFDRMCSARCEALTVSVCRVQNVGGLSTTESGINIPICLRVARE